MVSEGWNYIKFHKWRDLFSLLQQPSDLEGNLMLHPPAPSKKYPSSPFSLTKKRIYLDTLICYESCQGIPYLHRQSRRWMVTSC